MGKLMALVHVAERADGIIVRAYPAQLRKLPDARQVCYAAAVEVKARY